ncbi:MAG: helix-turn-helix domain-containing protein, partial [Thiohalospira sp.]
MIRTENHRKTLRARMVRYAEEHSISAAAREFDTTPQTVRKWVRRHQNGEPLSDRSRRPHSSPNKTDPATEQKVVQARRQTGYGPHRISDWLARTEKVQISPWTVRNILNRHNLVQKTTRRNTCYPAHWAWDKEDAEPFCLVQADVKDVRDKGTLGTERTTRIDRAGLPRYQWTFLEGQSRLRFLAYSRRLTRDCGVAFLSLCLDWLRRWDALPDGPVQIQTDWGSEFGGDNPERIEQLNGKYFRPRGGRLCRYPLGRKGYNGRVERSHRSDDEEFYQPLLLQIEDTAQYLDKAFQWEAFYNLYRPHYGVGMEGRTPMEKLRDLGLERHDSFALPPPIVLDKIAGTIVTQGGNHVPAKYTIVPPGGVCAGPSAVDARGPGGYFAPVCSSLPTAGQEPADVHLRSVRDGLPACLLLPQQRALRTRRGGGLPGVGAHLRAPVR